MWYDLSFISSLPTNFCFEPPSTGPDFPAKIVLSCVGGLVPVLAWGAWLHSPNYGPEQDHMSGWRVSRLCPQSLFSLPKSQLEAQRRNENITLESFSFLLRSSDSLKTQSRFLMAALWALLNCHYGFMVFALNIYPNRWMFSILTVFCSRHITEKHATDILLLLPAN